MGRGELLCFLVARAFRRVHIATCFAATYFCDSSSIGNLSHGNITRFPPGHMVVAYKEDSGYSILIFNQNTDL